MKIKYRAVIFDMDGTLLNTLQDLADSVNTGLEAMGFPKHDLESYKYFVGEGREIMAKKPMPENHRDPATLDKLVAHINVEYNRRWSEHTHAYAGVADLLDALSDLKLKLAILSNKPHDFTEKMAAKLLSKWHFDFILGVSPETPRKPDPSVALKIASSMKIDPACFIFVGDSDIDMKTARAAGMLACGALWGFRTREELLGGGAQELLEHPIDLLRLLA
jgi:phosphoglycolate phosphatase